MGPGIGLSWGNLLANSPEIAKASIGLLLPPPVVAPPTGVFVVEFAQGATGSIPSTPATATLTSTPAPGDVVYLTLTASAANRAITAVSGLGATWTQAALQNANSGSETVWQGLGATSAGVVTATVSASLNGSVHAFLVRGITDTTKVITGLTTATLSTAVLGPVVVAEAGQFVLVLTASATRPVSGGLLQGDVPATGWQIQDPPAGPTGYHSTGYRIPTETTPTDHQTEITATPATMFKQQFAVVLGSAPALANGFWGILQASS